MIQTHGIHHISSMVQGAQRNVDFYAGLLATRLVKQTLNYDDKSMYHLYYGNEDGSTGLITHFPMDRWRQGKLGGGQVAFSGYAVKPGTLDFWKERLDNFNIEYQELEVFASKRLRFMDKDGLGIDLIETDKGPVNTWEYNGVTEENAIVGIHDATIVSTYPQETLSLFTEILGYHLVDQDEENYLLKVNDDLGGILQLAKEKVSRGNMGKGTVHHIALKVLDDEIEDWIQILRDKGFDPTEVKDRNYFKSVYFREKGGLLIELATLSPGVTRDESVEDLGKELIIPPHFRGQALDDLEPIQVREISEI